MLDSNRTAFLFPGQGSQEIGMGNSLAQEYALAREVFEEADASLGLKISQLSWDGPEDNLNDTINTQPALLVHSVAALRVFLMLIPEFNPAFVAGHSMGEFSALVAAGALTFQDALKLVRRRGELMKSAGDSSPGGMAAILGLDIPTLDEICSQASTTEQIVQVANDNCPGQVVISGEKNALERAMAAAGEAGARKVVPLAVSIAAHSPLMTHAQEDFNQAVGVAPIAAPKIPVIGNVSAKPLTTPEEIREDLQAQLTERVRWTETIQFLLDQGVDTFVDVGTGNVLTGLVKRINRKTTRLSLGTPEDFAKIIQ
ncbi:MAG: ACP S-malonyltransferase [Anaerolineales bacterium]|nr:ACP S-malonyltransferase [Chloroflexota bacterium]MBL6981695.1 ACP S-malonyltransferase [Anaerolineales bacterium]